MTFSPKTSPKSQTASNTGDNTASATNSTPFFRTPYNYDTAKAGDEAAVPRSIWAGPEQPDHNPDMYEPTLTNQSMAEDADINTMMARMGITGKVPDPTPELYNYIMSGGGTLGDLAADFDYRTALDQVRTANELFMTYPGNIRAHFENDPGKFLAFVADEKNRDQLKAWGLLKPEPPAPELSHNTKAIVEALKGSQAINQGKPGEIIKP